jgi:hypothetical protein
MRVAQQLQQPLVCMHNFLIRPAGCMQGSGKRGARTVCKTERRLGQDGRH